MRIKVLQLAPLYQPLVAEMCYGGIERIMIGLDTEFVKTGIKSYIAGLKGTIIKGELLECKPTEDRYIKQAEKVLDFLKKERVNIVHIHRRDFLKTEAFVFCKNNKIPVLYTLHGPTKDLLTKFDFSIILKDNDNLFFNAVSYAQACSLSQYFPITKVINNGVDINLYKYYSKKRNHFLSFGRITREKGVHLAIQFAQKCNKILYIGGNIQDKNYFEAEIRPHIDGKNVKFLGEMSDQYKIPVFQKALSLLMFSECEDSCPLVVLEALSCGTPVIAFKKGGIPELIESGKTGFLIETINEGAQAVKNLIHVKNIDCRKSVEQNFSLNQMAKNYLALYLDLINKMQLYE